FERIGGKEADATLKGSRYVPITAALLVGTAPLYWFTAVRPLSDMPGLAAAVAVQGLILSAAGTAGLAIAAFLAAFAAGLRSRLSSSCWRQSVPFDSTEPAGLRSQRSLSPSAHTLCSICCFRNRSPRDTRCRSWCHSRFSPRMGC